MYESLELRSSSFHIYIFAFDAVSFNILREMKLLHATIVSLEDFETDELLSVKGERSKGEYCWTCTPSVISHVLERFGEASCTYIDADLCFFSDPSVLLDEFFRTGKEVMITDHRYSLLPKLYAQKRSGRFCVQFMTFLNNPGSLEVLHHWRDQCIDWCYARHEDGKFGDQKYLDVWPDIYNNIHILEHPGGGIAPWNLCDHRFMLSDGRMAGKIKKTGRKFDLVFYHFQYVRLLDDDKFDLGWYLISQNVKKLFYEDYTKRIISLEEMLETRFPGYIRGKSSQSGGSVLKKIMKKVFYYNIITV